MKTLRYHNPQEYNIAYLYIHVNAEAAANIFLISISIIV